MNYGELKCSKAYRHELLFSKIYLSFNKLSKHNILNNI